MSSDPIAASAASKYVPREGIGLQGSGTFFQRPDKLHHPLYVVTPVFNSQRFRSRWRLYEDFARHVECAGAILYTVEIAFGNRDFVVTRSGHPRHLRLRTKSEMWLKEAAINLMVQRLPRNWKYVAWIDADFHFARGDWADETLHKLQHYDMVQMYSSIQDLTPDHDPLGPSRSFADVWLEFGENVQPNGKRRKAPYGGPPGCPGGAWACTRDCWNGMGGLLDLAILGADDWYMAHAFTGQWDRIEWPAFHPRYRESMGVWADRADRYIKRNIGCVSGLALHGWHGPKVHRKYGTREQILVKYQYNPERDLFRDWQGLYSLDPQRIGLRDEIRRYFAERSEDSIDVPAAPK